MTPDVSVIIAAYNVEGYIKRAIDSALAQEGVSVEVVVVDDASTDKTWNVVVSYDDVRLKSFRSESNAGPSLTRNKAIEMASGKWIAVLDADDTFGRMRLSRCLALAQEQNADIIVDNIEVCSELDGSQKPMFNPKRFATIKKLDLAHFIKGNQSFLGRGEALGYLKPIFSADFLRRHQLRYNPDIRIGEDYMLMAEALACGADCVVDPSMGYRYTVRKGSISHRLSLEDIDRMIEGDRKFLSSHPLTRSALSAQFQRAKRLLQARHFTLFVSAIKQRDLVAMFKAWLSYPLAPLHLWEAIANRVPAFFARTFYD